jgi:biotin-dependent carboxylase-like uncharacterized protein
MSVRVLAPGLLTTVQDRGRHGWRHLGVGTAGAVDLFSHAVANLLAGNASDAAALEISLQGPRLQFDQSAVVAICGADIAARADGVDLPAWRRVSLPAGTRLALGACRRGARAYLAVAGGIGVPPVLGSCSTDLRGDFGGMHGRPLAAGDVLPMARSLPSPGGSIVVSPWWIDPTPDLLLHEGREQPVVVRVLPGRDASAPEHALFARPWRVGAASNRQGLRLDGDALSLRDGREAVSEPVAPGTIQQPPAGGPIVLLADAQTLGGYPRIGHAISADWPRLAQLRPGDLLRFEPCTASAARRLACEQRQRLARIAYAIAARTQTR